MEEETSAPISKITQKERKRIEIQKRKFQLEQDRMIKPGECNKYLKAIISDEILKEVSGSMVLEKLTEINIQTQISKDATPNTIMWKRRVSQKKITEDGNIIDFADTEKDEPYLMMILSADIFVKACKDKTLKNIVLAAQEICTDIPISTTLIVFGLKSFCRKHRNAITMNNVESALAQLELIANCSNRLHENPEDLAFTVQQVSKAIAEEPFKSKQAQKMDQEQFFVTGDTKVNANENDPDSLARLWHAQLMCLPKVTFDVAQSITKDYRMPRSMFEAYSKEKNNKNQMLADIPIIRTGPLSKSRRIGPELSRKISTLMTSKNPNDLL